MSGAGGIARTAGGMLGSAVLVLCFALLAAVLVAGGTLAIAALLGWT